MSSHLAPSSFDELLNPPPEALDAPSAPAGGAASHGEAPREPATAAPAPAARATTKVFGIEIGGFRRSGAARPAATTDLVIGGEPRVDLLPPEVKARRATRLLQRRLLTGVIVVALLVVAACGVAWYSRHQVAEQLAAEQTRTGTLITEQLTYSKVSALEQQTQFVETAEHVAGATDVDWQAYLDKVQATLPAGVTIQTVTVASETPLTQFAQAQTPLQGPRVATITFTATSKQVPDVSTWLDALAGLPGYADANPDTVNLATGQYSATITMHVNQAVFDGRFATKGSK